MSGVFPVWQPRYAAHGVATFPVRIEGKDKKPLVKHYAKIGKPYSAQLALRFPDANAFGFQCGKRSGITLIDIDSNDDRMVREAVRLFGESPIIWRTGSGNYAMPFRHSGERRRIRLNGLPIDVLGSGFAVAPPSVGAKGRYEFLQGSLTDLDRLPRLRVDRIAPAEAPRWREIIPGEIIPEGKRDDTIFRQLLREVRHCDDFDSLLDKARTINLKCEPPMTHAQVLKIAKSAWSIEINGKNWVGGKARASTDREEILALSPFPPAAMLLNLLRVSHPIPDNRFAIDQTKTAKLLSWGRSTVRTGKHENDPIRFRDQRHQGA